MIRDKTITNGDVVVTTTSLFWRAFLKSRGFTLVQEAPLENQTQSNGTHFTELNDLIALVNNLKNGWSRLHSVRIIKQLEQRQKEINGEIEDLNRVTESELWLLQALALEKSLLEDNYAVEKLYRKCLSGKFQVVLILNNLGVIQARMQRCREALALFKDAMFYANAFPKRIVKAPFNNFALVMAHLYRQRFVFQPEYLALLTEVIDSLPFLKHLRKKELNGDSNGQNRHSLSDSDIREAYLCIAKFAHDMVETPDDEFFHTKLAYVIPELDLLDSFGDVHDQFDREAAHKVFRKGFELAEQRRYAESINSFEMAGRLAPDYLKGSTEQIERMSDIWRRQHNEDILQLTEAEAFEEAIGKLQYLPDQRLTRQNDKVLLESIKKHKQISLLNEADELVAQEKYEEAKLRYKSLLREDLGEHLRKHVSSKLAGLLK